jgi:hypothetical protein
MSTPTCTSHNVNNDTHANNIINNFITPSTAASVGETTQAKNKGSVSVLEGAAVLEVAHLQHDKTCVSKEVSIQNPETAATKGAKEGMKAEMFYILNNHAFNVLVTMSIELVNSDGVPLFDHEIPSWNNSLKCKEWKPKMTHLTNEIIRCWTAYSWALHGIESFPRPKGGKLRKQ